MTICKASGAAPGQVALPACLRYLPTPGVVSERRGLASGWLYGRGWVRRLPEPQCPLL